MLFLKSRVGTQSLVEFLEGDQSVPLMSRLRRAEETPEEVV